MKRGLTFLVGAIVLALAPLLTPTTAQAITGVACVNSGPPGMDLSTIGGSGPRRSGTPVQLAVRNATLISQTPCQVVVTASLADVYGQNCGSSSVTTTADAYQSGIADVVLPPIRTCGAGRDQFSILFSQPGNPRYGIGEFGPQIGVLDPDPSTHDPFGKFLASSGSHVGMFLLESGFAVDRDTVDSNLHTKPISVRLTVDGATKTTVLANKDVGSYFDPSNDDFDHSFTASIFLGPNGGTHTVCAIGLNLAAGEDTLLGCQVVHLSPNPVGHLDQAANIGTGTSVSVHGWALDPNATGSIYTDIYVDGTQRARIKATAVRTDVDAAYHMGTNHGFAATVGGLATGHHTVCAYALNVYAGNANPQIGCIKT